MAPGSTSPVQSAGFIFGRQLLWHASIPDCQHGSMLSETIARCQLPLDGCRFPPNDHYGNATSQVAPRSLHCSGGQERLLIAIRNHAVCFSSSSSSLHSNRAAAAGGACTCGDRIIARCLRLDVALDVVSLDFDQRMPFCWHGASSRFQNSRMPCSPIPTSTVSTGSPSMLASCER